MVSLLGDYSYKFPEPIELKLKLQDLLEDEVDERYFLSDKALQGCVNTKFESAKLDNRVPQNDVIPTILARDYKDPKLVQVAQLQGKGFTEMTGQVYDSNGLSPTIQTMQGGNRQPKIIRDTYVGRKVKEFIDKYGYIPNKFNPYNNAEIKDIAPTQSTQCGSTTSSSAVLLKQEMCNKLIQDGKVKENDVIRHNYTTSKNGNCIQSNNESPTLDTRCDCLGVCVKTNNKRQKELANKIDLAKDNQFLDFYNQKSQENIAGTITTRVDASNATGIYKNLRIRKLTETECLRLMGVRDEYIKKMTCSRSQQYKQAGNGIVVDVLMAIFKQML